MKIFHLFFITDGTSAGKKAGIMQKFFKLFSTVRVINVFAAKPADRQEPQQTGFGRKRRHKKTASSTPPGGNLLSPSKISGL